MSDLKRRLDKVYDRKVIKVHTDKVRRAALDLLGTIKVATPVGDPDLWKNPAPPGYVGGAARSNWHLDIGTPTVRIVEPGQDLDASTAGYTIDKTIFISNNLPYIRRLNEGHSQQAPAGFVEDSIAAVKGRIRKR